MLITLVHVEWHAPGVMYRNMTAQRFLSIFALFDKHRIQCPLNMVNNIAVRNYCLINFPVILMFSLVNLKKNSPLLKFFIETLSPVFIWVDKTFFPVKSKI